MTLYFGRGSSNCIGFRAVPGHKYEIFIGNAKSGEEGIKYTGDRWELMRLADFFRAMWEDCGNELYIAPLTDDPHDETLFHDLDLTQIE